MKVAIALLILLLNTAAALAQPVNGFYVQGGAGLALPQQQSISLPPAPLAPPDPSATAAANAAIDGKAGAAQSGSAGWGNGQGLRLEFEGIHTGQPSGTPN